MSRALSLRRKMAIAVVMALGLFRTLTCGAAEEFTLESARGAAQKGGALAGDFLAKHCAKGEGVPQDYTRAASHPHQTAEQGAFAENDWGAFYAKGWE